MQKTRQTPLRGHEVSLPSSAAMKDVDSAAAREQFLGYTRYAAEVGASSNSKSLYAVLCGVFHFVYTLQ